MRVFPLLLAVIMIIIASQADGQSAASGSIKTKLINAQQQEVGEATLTDTPNGVLIRLSLRANPPGISSGTHAVHIHETGKCEPPFKTAGGHFDPMNKKHGFLAEQGKHAGDLPNILVVENAALTVEHLVPEVTLKDGKASLLNNDGSALVVHEGADDYRTDPAGDSGERVACAVIQDESQAEKR